MNRTDRTESPAHVMNVKDLVMFMLVSAIAFHQVDRIVFIIAGSQTIFMEDLMYILTERDGSTWTVTPERYIAWIECGQLSRLDSIVYCSEISE